GVGRVEPQRRKLRRGVLVELRRLPELEQGAAGLVHGSLLGFRTRDGKQLRPPWLRKPWAERTIPATYRPLWPVRGGRDVAAGLHRRLRRRPARQPRNGVRRHGAVGPLPRPGLRR